MDREDPKEPEKEGRREKKSMRDTTKMAAAVAVTATVLSPTVRALLRQGAVRGLAGVLVLGDAIGSFARGVGRGISEGTASPEGPVEEGAMQSAASALEAAREAARAAQEAARAAQEAAEAARAAAGLNAAPRARKRRPRSGDPQEEGRTDPDA